MDNEMKHESHAMPPHDHHHKHGKGGCWAGWHSPVGLGIFFLTTALAAAIALYALLNLLGAVMSIMRPAPTYSYPQDMNTTQTVPAGSDGGSLTQ